MIETIAVLDHGYVKFIGSMGTDETIIEAARMSTGKGFLGWEPGRACLKCGLSAARLDGYGARDNPCKDGEHKVAEHKGDASLLEFLYKNQHHTPLEMCELAVEAYWPIMVGREAMRHRVFNFNEFSARYAQMPNEHYVPDVSRFEPKLTKNRQESSALQLSSAEWGVLDNVSDMTSCVKRDQEATYNLYEQLLARGVPKEVARINTPVSRYTRVRMKGNLRNWLQFLALRDHPAAQWEIREYAKVIDRIVSERWPRTHALYVEHTKNAVTLSASEVAEMKALLKGDKHLPREEWLHDLDKLSEGFLARFK